MMKMRSMVVPRGCNVPSSDDEEKQLEADLSSINIFMESLSP